jgi:hypothetical protein
VVQPFAGSSKTLVATLVAAVFVIAPATSFADKVVVGDLSPDSPPQDFGFGGGTLIAQPFTLASPGSVNQVALAWWNTSLSIRPAGPIPSTVTIYIADGLGAGSHNLLTLHEPLNTVRD